MPKLTSISLRFLFFEAQIKCLKIVAHPEKTLENPVNPYKNFARIFLLSVLWLRSLFVKFLRFPQREYTSVSILAICIANIGVCGVNGVNAARITQLDLFRSPNLIF